MTAEVPVTVRSVGGAEATTLTGGAGTTIALPGGSTLVGLTITGGDAAAGGGVRSTSPGTVTLEGCVVAGNRAALGGGLSVAPGGHAVLVDTVVRDNDADQGGGGVAVGEGGVLELLGTSSVTANHAVWFGAGVVLDGASLIGGRVDGNTLDVELDEILEDYLVLPAPVTSYVPTDTLGGAGVSATGTSTLTAVEIVGNIGQGGGLAAVEGEVTLTDVAVQDNRAGVGGGVLAIDATVIAAGTTEIAANQARRGAGIAAYGAILEGGVVRDNVATDDAGGIWLSGASVAGATVSGNQASEGGGLRTEGASTVSGVAVTGNVADDGGGLATREDAALVHTVAVVGSTFDGNEAGSGGAVYAQSEVVLVDTWLRDNVATNDGGGLRLYVPIPDSPGAPTPDAAVSVTVSGGGVLRNVAPAGGGASVAVGRLRVDGADFGDGGDDNTAADVSTGAGLVHGYGAGASFECTGSGCTPEP